MKTIFYILGLASIIFGQESEKYFEGFGLTLQKSTDAMTDESSCTIIADMGSIVAAFVSTKSLMLLPKQENFTFSKEEKHLLRIGKEKPYTLSALKDRNLIYLDDKSKIPNIVKALANGDSLKLRIFEWPSNQGYDQSLSAPALGYVYALASAKCGWEKGDYRSEVPKPKLSIYESPDPDSKGYASVKVVGNEDLGLQRNFEKYGGGCHIEMGVNKLFGYVKKKPTCDEVSITGPGYLVISDSTGKVLFREAIPSHYSTSNSGNPWPKSYEAAKAAAKAGWIGTMKLENIITPGISEVKLYGFSELWQWGTVNCGFPPLK